MKQKITQKIFQISCSPHTDRPQIYDVKSINRLQENIIEALKVQMGRLHGGPEASTMFSRLLIKINELRAIGSSHSLHLHWFRSNWHRLKLPPLFAEIFDIPRSAPVITNNDNDFISHQNVSSIKQEMPDQNQQQQQQQQSVQPQYDVQTMAPMSHHNLIYAHHINDGTQTIIGPDSAHQDLYSQKDSVPL